MASLLTKAARKVRDTFAPKPQQAAEDSPIAATVPTQRKANLSGLGELQNLSVNTDVSQIQAALRAAERGDTLLLFALYRDMLIGFSHLQAEWSKRKMVVIGQPHSLLPYRKGNANDEKAAKVIQQMIDKCENWMDGMNHLLDATLYPVSVCEKLFREPQSEDNLEFPVRFLLRRLEPVNPSLLCFRAPYSPGFDLNYDSSSFEPDLRIYSTLNNGYINLGLSQAYEPEKVRHIVYRGNFLSRSIRDNFGGQMRAILFWWLLATKGRDWWGLYMQKYGSPFILGKADAQQSDTVKMLQAAFAMASQIGGLVIDKRAEAELIQAAASDGANAHKILKDACNEEVSKIVVGQVLSSTAKNTGLGSGMADFHGEVRDDIRKYDWMKLAECLANQLFTQYLQINSIPGNAPKINWGGKRDGDASAQASTLKDLRLAGIQPTEEGLGVLSERFGYGIERAPEPVMSDPKGKEKAPNGDN